MSSFLVGTAAVVEEIEVVVDAVAVEDDVEVVEEDDEEEEEIGAEEDAVVVVVGLLLGACRVAIACVVGEEVAGAGLGGADAQSFASWIKWRR